MDDVFPNSDVFASAVLLLHAEDSAILQQIKHSTKWDQHIDDNHVAEMRKSLVDMVMYSGKGIITRCDVFAQLRPESAGYPFVLREFDRMSSGPDMSLNYCADPNLPLYSPFSPEKFKLGSPTPGQWNDCGGAAWYLEIAALGENLEEMQGTGCTSVIPARLYANLIGVGGHENRDQAVRKARNARWKTAANPNCGTDELTTVHPEDAENATIPKRKRFLSYKEKLMLLSVKSFFDEVQEGTVMLRRHASTKNTAMACQVTKRIVQRIVQQNNNGTLKKDLRRKRPGLLFDEMSLGIIRHTVLNFYGTGNYPTLNKIYEKVVARTHDDENFPKCGREVLRKVMLRMNFAYMKKDAFKLYYEQPRIIAQRHGYLRKIRKFRRDGYNIFYQDETWANQRISKEKTWLLVKNPGSLIVETEGGLRVPTGLGKRIIVNHVGSEEGFLDGVADIFVAKTGTPDDYHTSMNIQHFMRWFVDELLPNVPNKSVLVVDNALYHNSVSEDTRNPTTSWRKAQIQDWLRSRNIAFAPGHLKVELLEIAKRHRVEGAYLTDIAVAETGRNIVVLRLPIAHCNLNPIELIWAWVKRKIAERNKTFKTRDVLRLTKEVINEVTAEQWVKAIGHVKKVEQEYWEKDALIDIADVRDLIVPIDDDDDDCDEEQGGQGYDIDTDNNDEIEGEEGTTADGDDDQ